MPDLPTHQRKAALTSGIADLARQFEQIWNYPWPSRDLSELAHRFAERFDPFELLVAMGIGTACAGLPDIIEPATSPFHRGFFHSVLMGVIVAYAAFGSHTQKLSPDARLLLCLAALAYLHHLYSDSQTPMGIRLI
jgi:hypothetical protein